MNIASRFNSLHFLRTGFFFVVFLNLIYLNFIILRNNHNRSFSSQEVSVVEENSIATEAPCLQDCIDDIYEAIHLATSSAQKKNTSEVSLTNQGAEYYIPFGSGVSSSEEWSDVAGLQAYIDSNKYPNMKSVRFEASLYTPTGNQKAYARLFNVTDGHPVWFSEVSLEGGEPKLMISDSIILDSGNKLYSVQMKTSLKFRSELSQARIHIVLQ